MDTILASIRRILNEDEVAPTEAPPDRRDLAPSLPDQSDKDDVLVLGKAMMVSPEAEPMQGSKPVPPAIAVAPPPPAAPAASAVTASTPAEPEPEPEPSLPQDRATVEGLIAARTRAAATQSFDALHEAMRREQMPVPPPAPSSPNLLRSGGPTLEDLVRDELRGLISQWLDQHLPGMVETLVRTEIEKMTRRPG